MSCGITVLENPFWEWVFGKNYTHFGLPFKLESLSFHAILPIPTDFHTHCKYENNTSPCGMPCSVRHCTRPGGLNTISAVVCSLHSRREHNSSITGFFLPGHSMSMCLPSSCAPLCAPMQKEWLITPSCCMPIKYYYSCFVYEKKKGQEKSSGGCRGMFVDSAHLLKIYALD